MTEIILMYVENGLTILVALSIYLYLLASLYPRLTMRTVWKAGRQGNGTGDRGIRKLVFPGGRAIIYRPAPKMRRFIRCYALIKQDGCTYIKCRIHERIAHIRYDVATFDRKGRLLDILGVSERITEYGQTRTVRLPRATAYACVILRKADNMYEGRDATVGYSLVGIGIYTMLSVVTAILAGYILHGSLSAILATLPLGGHVSSLTVTLAAAAVLGGISAEWVVLMHYLHASKVINR